MTKVTASKGRVNDTKSGLEFFHANLHHVNQRHCIAPASNFPGK